MTQSLADGQYPLKLPGANSSLTNPLKIRYDYYRFAFAALQKR